MLAVLYRCVSSGIRAGLRHPPGIRELHNLEQAHGRHEPVAPEPTAQRLSLEAKIYDMRLRMLETYPTRARNDQMECFDSLMAEALQHDDRSGEPGEVVASGVGAVPHPDMTISEDEAVHISEPEGRHATDKRADIQVICDGFNVPIKIKKNANRGLWDAIVVS